MSREWLGEMTQLYDLNRPCKTCGELLRTHVWSRCTCRVFIRPCAKRIALDFPEEWDYHVSGDGSSCRFCGEPLVDHFHFEVFSIRVMNQVIEEKREISLQNAVSFSGCASHSDEP